MKEKRKSHKLLSLLLCCAVLIGMMPMTAGTAFAADTETHPEKVNFLDNGEDRLCYYTDKWDAYGSREYKKVSTSEITDNTDDEKWQSFTTKYATKGIGWIYYIQETGTLYIKGTIPSIAFQSKADAENVLKVIVAGDTTIERSIYGYVGNMGSVAPGLKKMTIEFRNGSTLILSKNETNEKKAILDITKTDGNAVRSYGDLELTGDGTLKIAPADYTPNVMFGIRANNISVLDNVSLDIKMGSRYDLMKPVSAAAITCDGKLNIDTTGTVKIDVSEKIDSSAKDDRGYFKVFSNVTNTTFNLTCAKSVTLKSREKKDTFVAYSENLTGGENWYSTIMTDLEKNGWKISESADTAKPSYSVTMTRAGLSDAVLKVGSQEFKRTSAVTEGDLQADGSKQNLSIKVEVPAWLTTLKNADRVDYNYTAAVYENGTKLSNTFNLTTGGSSDGTSTLHLTFAGDFKPTAAGKNYIVTFSITPKVKATGEKLTDYAINGNWLLTAVEQKNTEITSVTLTSPGMQEGATSGGDFTGTNTGVATTTTVWLNDLTGGAKLNTLYTAKVTLTAKDGYVFTKDTAVNVTNNSGYYEVGTPSISADGKTMTVRVLVAATHDHQWKWKDNENDTHSQVCTLTGCNAKKDTENHTYTTTETATEIQYTCTKCGKTRTETKTGENVIWAISAPVTAPKANESAAGTWVTLNNQYAEDAEITSAKWTEGNADAAAAAGEFSGKFNAYSTYTLTVTFTAKGEKAFRNPQLWRPLRCLDGTPSAATVSEDGKTLTQSITFTIKMPVSVKVTLNDLADDGSIVPPTIEEGKAAGSLLSVNINKGERIYSYSYSNRTWTKVSTGDGDATPKLAAGESATLGLALLGAGDAEYFARLESTDNVKGLVAGAYAEKNGVYATYAVADESTAKTITSVDLTVTAPEYGKAPATNATVPTGANYSAGTPEWSPAVTDGKFGTGTYTVSIPVTAADGYSFAAGCVYTVNGYTATYNDTNKTVSYTFPALIAPHSHSYGAWARLDDSYHSRTCTAGDDIQVEAHTWGSWKALSGIDEHERTCTACGAKQTEKHNWTVESVENATFESEGTIYYKCSGCGAGKSSSIAQLVKIDVANLTVAKPVKGAAATEASTTDTAYYVAATEWVAADSTVLDIANGDKFQPGTVYTVKIELGAIDSKRFTDTTEFNINGQKATVVGTAPTTTGTEIVTLTYQFPATGSGSTGGGSTVQKPEITIIGSGKADLSIDGRTATIAADAGNELVSITLNGKEVAKTDKLTGLRTGDKVVITFQKKAEDPAVVAKTVATKVSQMQLIARSSKTAKKNIQVTVKGDAKTAALIKDIQDLGYTVKYKFYRSTKKSASYKGMLTKTETRYFNTIGTKGTMYYYKARLMVYDKAGKLVTYSKLTQCKYANRMWSK